MRVDHSAEVTMVPLGHWMLGQPFFSVQVPWHSSLKTISAHRGHHPLPQSHVLYTVPTVPNVFLHSSRLVRVFSPSRRLGQTMRYRYSRRHHDVRFLPFFLVPNLDYVKRFALEIHHPPEITVKLQWWSREGEPAPILERKASGARASSRLVLHNLRALPPRPWDPLDNPRALFWLTLLLDNQPLHPVEAGAFVRWTRSLFDKAATLGPEGQALARRLVAGLASERARAAAIHDFVRKEVRYIADVRGTGAVTPRQAEEVLRRRWGDCKDKTALFMALARHVGLAVDPVLVATEERPPAEGAMHPGMYDHAIAMVRLGSERVFSDPTASTVPFGSLPAMVEDSLALVLDPANPREERIPVQTSGPEILGTLELSVTDPSRARARLALQGTLLYEAAVLRRGPGQEGWEERLAALLSGLLPDIRFEKLQLISDTSQALHVEAEADLGRLVLHAERRIFLRRTPSPPCPFGLAARAKDQAPLLLPPLVSLDLTFLVPAAAPQTLDPCVKHRASNLAWFESHAQQREGHVALRLRQGRRPRFLSGTAKADYIRFCGEVRAPAKGYFALDWDTRHGEP